MKYKMKFFGSVTGNTGKRKNYSFDKGQIIEAPEGEFPLSVAEPLEEKREVEISESVKVETNSFDHKKRNKR